MWKYLPICLFNMIKKKILHAGDKTKSTNDPLSSFSKKKKRKKRRLLWNFKNCKYLWKNSYTFCVIWSCHHKHFLLGVIPWDSSQKQTLSFNLKTFQLITMTQTGRKKCKYYLHISNRKLFYLLQCVFLCHFSFPICISLVYTNLPAIIPPLYIFGMLYWQKKCDLTRLFMVNYSFKNTEKKRLKKLHKYAKNQTVIVKKSVSCMIL